MTAVVGVLAGDHGSITDVIVFARLLVPLTEDPPRWIARINAWPVIRSLPPAPGSSYEDLIIADVSVAWLVATTPPAP